MKITLTAIILLISTLPLAAQTIKVGTLDTRAVALAFYRSPNWNRVLKEKRAEMDAAKRAGQHQRITELDKWGQAQQELAHKQVFGSAPIPNVLDQLAPAFPEIAKAAGVAIIAADFPFIDKSVEKVDVTMHIVDWLKSTDQTRAMVKSIREKSPARGDAQHKH